MTLVNEHSVGQVDDITNHVDILYEVVNPFQ